VPSSQRPPTFSGLSSPIRGRSVTHDHTVPGPAETVTLREIVGSTPRR
jgi:hypothetical protein